MSFDRLSLSPSPMVPIRSINSPSPLLVERRAVVVLGQDALEGRVLLLDGDHGIVDDLADGRLLGLALDMPPPGLLRDPEDVLGGVLVPVSSASASLSSLRTSYRS